MAQAFVAYYNRVTEYEAGWGSRPDGFLIANSPELFNAKATSIKAAGDHQEFSAVDGPPILCRVSEEMHKKLETQGTVWTNAKDWKLD